MSPEAWGFFGVLTVTSGGILTEQIRTRRRLDRAAHVADETRDVAQEAADLARPTGNGFARRVEAKLDRLEAKIDRHIEDHATADVQRRK